MRITIALVSVCVGFFSVSSARADAPCSSVTASQATKIAEQLQPQTSYFEYGESSWKTVNDLAIIGSGSQLRRIRLNGVMVATGSIYVFAGTVAYNLAWAVDCRADGYPSTISLAPPAINRAAPWIERAEKVLPWLLAGETGATVATAVTARTHTYWKKPSLKGYDVIRMGDRISVRISINWQGSIISHADGSGNVYTTNVVWEFSERGHVSATVTSESGSGMPNAGEARQVDEWFRNELYPILYQNAGG